MSPSEVATTAKGFTVLIDGDFGNGSGAIVHRDGNTYTVLTAAHVVRNQNSAYKIVTPDEKEYAITPSEIKLFPTGIDLAIVRFRSDRVYPIAKLGSARRVSEGKVAYVAGFPAATQAITRPIFNFTEGKITAKTDRPLADGYGLVYTNNTLPGMSGGAVLDDNGELVGLHGKGDVEKNTDASDINPNIRIKTGFNLGIPIDTFISQAARVGVALPAAITATPSPTNAANSDGDAIVQAAIASQSDNPQAAIAVLDNAIQRNPNSAPTFRQRGIVKWQAGDKQGAIADYTRAIQLNPDEPLTYIQRAFARSRLGDLPGAIADYSSALTLEPNNGDTWNNRAIVYAKLGEHSQALRDYDRGLRLNPNNAEVYFNRAWSQFSTNKLDLAMKDLDTAIRLAPDYAQAYHKRGQLKMQLRDRNGAIADLRIAERIYRLRRQPRRQRQVIALLQSLNTPAANPTFPTPPQRNSPPIRRYPS
jgi:Flp pilus assembly protein TadD